MEKYIRDSFFMDKCISVLTRYPKDIGVPGRFWSASNSMGIIFSREGIGLFAAVQTMIEKKIKTYKTNDAIYKIKQGFTPDKITLIIEDKKTKEVYDLDITYLMFEFSKSKILACY